MSYNAQSIGNKIVDIIEFASRNNVAVLALQEIWINSADSVFTSTIKDLGYNCILKTRKRHGGGVGFVS